MKRIGTWLAAFSGVIAPPLAALASEGKAPLPQLDVTRYPGLLFWLAITFPLLFVLMRFVAVPRVHKAQDGRRQALRTDFESAEADNEQARTLRESYEKTLAEARSGAQAAISGIVAAAAEEESKQRAVQQQELNRRIAEAEKRINSFRDTALKEGREAAADLAEAIIGKLTGGVAAKKRA